MATLDRSSEIDKVDRNSEALEQAGYAYFFDREIFVNRKTRKVFSMEFVEDHDEAEILKRIKENNGGGDWRFYFNSEPSAAVRRELQKELG